MAYHCILCNKLLILFFKKSHSWLEKAYIPKVETLMSLPKIEPQKPLYKLSWDLDSTKLCLPSTEHDTRHLVTYASGGERVGPLQILHLINKVFFSNSMRCLVICSKSSRCIPRKLRNHTNKDSVLDTWKLALDPDHSVEQPYKPFPRKVGRSVSSNLIYSSLGNRLRCARLKRT